MRQTPLRLLTAVDTHTSMLQARPLCTYLKESGICWCGKLHVPDAAAAGMCLPSGLSRLMSWAAIVQRQHACCMCLMLVFGP